MRALRVAVVLLALLLVPSVTAGWSQFHGDAGRQATVSPDGPFDISTSWPGHQAALGDGSWSPMALATAEGAIVARDCGLARFPDGDVGVRVSPCEDISLQAVDEARGIAVACVVAPRDEPVLIGFGLDDLRPVWQVVPTRDLGAGSADPMSATWGCRGATHDPATGRLVVAFSPRTPSYSIEHRIAHIDIIDGSVFWSIPLVLDRIGVEGVLDPVALDKGVFYPMGITRTTAGLVVTGLAPCASCTGSFTLTSTLVWAPWDGNEVPGEGGSFSADATAPSTGSAFAAAQDRLAAAVVGDRLVVVDPGARDAGLSVSVGTLRSDDPATLAPPVWLGGDLVVPLETTLAVFDGATLKERWTWGQGLGWRITDVTSSATGALHVVTDGPEGREEGRLTTLDVRDGTTRQILPLPDGISTSALQLPYRGQRLQSVPMEDGLLVVSSDGGHVVARPSTGAYADLSTRYPAQGETVSLDVDGGLEAVGHHVVWGDGTVTEHAAGVPLEHAYRDNGDHRIVLTSVLDGGFARATTLAVHVGAEDPATLTFMQKAFAPGNQDMAWGIISLILVALSLFVAFGRHWWRRHRMRRSVREIDEVEAAAAALPTDPISALESHRSDLRHRVASGRMSEDHFNFLDREIRRRLRLHRMHVLGPYLARMSSHYGRLLESSLDDGIVNDAERSSLIAALSRERRLKGPEKNELRRLITDWAGAAAWADGRPKPKDRYRLS
ncbi:MAG: hypothetical protein KY455_06715 [Euryarchaeota archaeon]|nr:hypothetical protein [Euryarchaeota archaeon]